MRSDDARSPGLMALAEDYARQVAEAGGAMGLPFIAVAADIGSPEPMRGADGRPMAETVFRWLDPELRYWEDRGFALKAAFVRMTRICAEPFYFKAGRFGSWRPNAAIEALMREGEVESFGVGAAIVAPAYQPGGVIGAVVWATPDPAFEIEGLFAARASDLQALAMKFVGAYEEATADGPVLDATRLTRREIQCLKWAAAGKTDVEISQIVGISLPTVRLHITNASRRLGVSGRSRAVRHAAVLGYIGSEFGGRAEA